MILIGLLWVNTRPAEGGAFTPTASPCVQQGLLPPPDDDQLRVLVVGDSVALQIGEALCGWAVDHPGQMVVLNESHLGCVVGRHGLKRIPEGDEGPVGEICSAWNETVPTHVMMDSEVVSWPSAVAGRHVRGGMESGRSRYVVRGACWSCGGRGDGRALCVREPGRRVEPGSSCRSL